ncbi:MAG TPA: leucine/isoleucine/valine transporter permease subunit [candidate division Zixibacteria bacterium]|nr:leucine/isoleucine/valine transporter permease subunit [candidate division Zixibacteria bacterium]
MTALLRRSLLFGLIAGAACLHIGLVGMIDTFQERTLLDLRMLAGGAGVALGFLMPLLAIVIVANRAVARPAHDDAPAAPVPRLLAGLLVGAMGGIFLALLAYISDSGVASSVLVNARRPLATILWLGMEPGPGTILLIGLGAVAGLVGAALVVLPPLITRSLVVAGLTVLLFGLLEPFLSVILRNLGLEVVEELVYARGAVQLPAGIALGAIAVAAVVGLRSGGGVRRRTGQQLRGNRATLVRWALLGLALVLLLVLPNIVGRRLSDVLTQVGLFVLLGLGLNIVVGFAGLLDLGYVAFYAVGAYSVGVLTSPASPAFAPQLPFWGSLPFVIILAVIIGLMIGAPVLRLRGDYLAIVTLGFGEIARILVGSAWLQPYLGGAQGITPIPAAEPFGRAPESIYYPILAFCVLAALVAMSLANSRVGRAWNAMREDESAAEATGINTTVYKLLAFAIGAAIGCLAGAFFSAKIGTIFPDSFNILISINTLALIILGGMGNILGVIVGALVLVGLPELLREFEAYRLLIYGAVLVTMMLLRPEGLLPSRQRQAELHEGQEEEAGEGDEPTAPTTREPREASITP